MKLMTEIRARLPGGAVSSTPGSTGVPAPPNSGSFTIAAVSVWDRSRASRPAELSALTPSGRSARKSTNASSPPLPWRTKWARASRSTA